jgi:hypothetical protein
LGVFNGFVYCFKGLVYNGVLRKIKNKRSLNLYGGHNFDQSFEESSLGKTEYDVENNFTVGMDED